MWSWFSFGVGIIVGILLFIGVLRKDENDDSRPDK